MNAADIKFVLGINVFELFSFEWEVLCKFHLSSIDYLTSDDVIRHPGRCGGLLTCGN